MTEKEVRTRSNQYNQITHQKQFIHELFHATWNHRHIIDAFESGRAKDLSEEPKKEGKKCIVTGSGPSLDKVLPLLKEWKGDIICTTSQASTLMYYGVEPTYILALDPFCWWSLIDGIEWEKTKTKLILCPTTWPELVEKWPNEMLLYRQDLAGTNTFYSNEMNHMYAKRDLIPGKGERDFQFTPYIRTQMTLFSCSPPAQLFAADNMKYDTVYLCGVDFAYNKEKTRFTKWSKDSGEWVESIAEYKPPKKEADKASNADTAEVETNNGLLTTPQHLFYKKNMFSAMRLSMQNIFVVGEGAITELRTITPEKLISDQGKKAPRMDKTEQAYAYEKYLASVGGYVIVSERAAAEAFTFIESENPDFEIPDYMTKMIVSYQCDGCKIVQNATDYQTPVEMIKAMEQEKDILLRVDKHKQLVREVKKRIKAIPDRNGEPCPKCQKGKMQRIFKVDINGNMRRYEKWNKKIKWSEYE